MIHFDITTKVHNAINGDKDAFSDLFTSYQKQLYIYSVVMLHDTEDAQDIVQETFMNAFVSINTLRDDKYFKTWITKILINNCKKFKRNKYKKKLEPLSGTDLWCEPLNIEELDLMNSLNKLDRKGKELITLRFFNDLSISEIGIVLNIPEGTVKSRLNRSIKKLKKIMEVY